MLWRTRGNPERPDSVGPQHSSQAFATMDFHRVQDKHHEEENQNGGILKHHLEEIRDDAIRRERLDKVPPRASETLRGAISKVSQKEVRQVRVQRVVLCSATGHHDTTKYDRHRSGIASSKSADACAQERKTRSLTVTGYVSYGQSLMCKKRRNAILADGKYVESMMSPDNAIYARKVRTEPS